MLLTIYYVVIGKTMSPESHKKTLWLSFVNPRNGRSSCSFVDFLQNRCSYKFRKFHWKTLVLECLFDKVWKNRLQTQMFCREILWIFKNIFFTEHLQCLVLEGVCEGTSFVKVLQSCHFNIFGINHRCFRKMPIKKNNE